jgi:ribosomal protein L11
VGIYGEMAGDLEAIPAAKTLVGSLTLPQAQEIAQEAPSKGTADDVREYLRTVGLAWS